MYTIFHYDDGGTLLYWDNSPGSKYPDMIYIGGSETWEGDDIDFDSEFGKTTFTTLQDAKDYAVSWYEEDVIEEEEVGTEWGEMIISHNKQSIETFKNLQFEEPTPVDDTFVDEGHYLFGDDYEVADNYDQWLDNHVNSGK